MNAGFGEDFYRKGNSVKSYGHSVNHRTLKTEKLLSSSAFLEGALKLGPPRSHKSQSRRPQGH